MGDASEMSSVQSAFEDLVLENPNRRKMEVCLLATMMMIVICICALCIFVLATLHPKENIKAFPATRSLTLFSGGDNDALYYRIMGWVSWGMYPCHGIHAWACSRRAYESPELSVTYTSQEMAREGAMEFFNMAINVDHHTSEKLGKNIWKKNSMMYMTSFMSACTKGYQNSPGNTTFMKDFVALVKKKFNTDCFIDSGVDVQPMLVFFAKSLLFFPFHKVEIRKSDPSKPAVAYVHPMKFIMKKENYGDTKAQAAYLKAFHTFGEAGFSHPDEGKAVFDREHALVKLTLRDEKKPSKDKDGDAIKDIILQPTEAQVSGFANKHWHFDKLLEDVFGYKGDKLSPLTPSIPLVSQETGNSAPKLVWNYSMFKIGLHFAPVWATETNMASALSFAALHLFNREKKISPMLHCARLAERYFRPAVMKVVFWITLSLPSVPKNITDALTYEMQDKGGIKESLSDASSFFDTPGPRDAFMGVYTPTSKKLKVFTPPEADITTFLDSMDKLPDPTKVNAATKAPYTALYLMAEAGAMMTELEKGGVTLWPGDIFSGEVTYDAVDDSVYVPLGVGLPPYYHTNSKTNSNNKMIAHTIPSLVWPIITAMLHRVVSRGYQVDVTVPAPEPVFRAPLDKKLKKRVHCFMEKGFRDPAMALLRKVALDATYQLYRKAYNKKSGEAGNQFRIALIPFISEEEIFFLSAAQAFCKVASDKAHPDVQKNAEIMLDDPFAGVFYQKTIGCSGQRSMSQEGCEGFFTWKVTDEQLSSVRVLNLQK
ncbi:uncharacterized protein LOC135378469 [Ornithodoros turicata]|uniref:uncharacterized protein LOC135378469 n=1 Tax=Ornithodoros turicata TaxID=34597 RepID=UPI003139B8BB